MLARKARIRICRNVSQSFAVGVRTVIFRKSARLGENGVIGCLFMDEREGFLVPNDRETTQRARDAASRHG